MNDHSKKRDPNLAELERAKAEAERAKKQFSSTLGTLQYRLKPGTLANEAWSGVKEKSGVVADGALQTVKERPVTTSGVIAAFAIFLAREPLWRLVSRYFRNEDDSDLVTTELKIEDKNYDLAAPAASRTVKEGVSA